MGSDDSTGAKLAVRCCQGAYFAVGFVVTTITFAVMFWIVWCYFGIAIVHISDSQRRALVNYSYSTKPQPTPTSPAPRLESSITNTVAKSVVDGAALNRGSSAAHPAASISSNQSPVRAKDEKDAAVPVPILNGSSEESSEEDGLYVRRVSSEVGDNNRPDSAPPADESGGRRSSLEKDSSRRNIEPSQVHDDSGRSRKPEEDRGKAVVDEIKPASRDHVGKDSVLPPRRDDIQPSRRTDSESTYDESDYPRRYDDDSDRGRPRRRYSDGERRIYADDDRAVDRERDRRLPADDRYYDDRLPDRSRARDDRYADRYPEDTVRRSDDDRYYRDRDYDDRRKEDRSRIRGSETKRRPDEDDKYIRRDERYRDDERYSEEERYRRRGGVGYSSRDDDEKYRSRDEDRYRDERDRTYAPRKPLIRETDDRKEYLSSSDVRARDRDYRDPPLSSRTDSERPLRNDRPISPSYDDRPIENSRVLEDRDKSYAIDDIAPSRVDAPSRTPENRYKNREDEYRRPTRYDVIDDDIRPTKTRDAEYIAPPSISSSRPRNDERYIDDSRRRDSGYYDDELKRRGDGTRGVSIGGSRRVVQEDEYRTRVPNEKREEVVLDRRSYASEEDDYRRSDSRTRTAYDDDRVRRPYSDDRRDYESPKRVYVEERPSRPTRVDDDYDRSRPKGDYDSSRTRQRDRLDDDYRRYDRDDDRYVSRGDDKYIPRDDDRYPRDNRPASTIRDYSRYPEDTSRAKPRDSDRLAVGKDALPRSEDRDIRSRSDRYDEIPPRTDTRDAYAENRKYDDVSSSQGRVSKDVYESGSSSGSRRNLESSSAKEPLIGPPITSSAYSKEPSRVYLREKRYQVTESSKGLRDDSYPETREVQRDPPDDFVERPFDVKDVIGTAIRQTDGERQNKKVHYPVLDPRISNLTSPYVIRASERKGTTITAKRRRKRTMEYILPK